MDIQVKTCVTCLVQKPTSEFHRDKNRHKPWCKPCRSKARKDNKWSNGRVGREAELRARLRDRYGITLEYREEIRQSQNNKCAICKEYDDNLFVDHCHNTGIVRGLLCSKCNSGLGMFRDNIDFLKGAIEYLG